MTRSTLPRHARMARADVLALAVGIALFLGGLTFFVWRVIEGAQRETRITPAEASPVALG
ncbi:MAG: hypothetical protein IT361_02995 [Gemmatimonadaceae bacterium]|nr:hypothetical protein [Gemmatimonadaceae bacterium]